MSNLIDSYQQEFEKATEFLKKELGSLRSSRASSSLVDGISVPVYGAKMSLKEVASIVVEDAKTILVEVWDKNNLKIVEKAIFDAGNGLTPTLDGNRIRISLPMLNEDKRKELVKIVHQKAEQARIALRGTRDSIREEIIKKEKNKEMAEDEKFRLFKLLDEKITEYNDKVKEIVEKKEKEILTI